KAMMGTGEASGEDRAIQAAEKAIANPLLDEISLKGAKGVLINITGSEDMTLFELDEAANRIRDEVDPEANIIVGSTLDPEMDGMIRVSVVATGIDAVEGAQTAPTQRRIPEPVAATPVPASEPVEEVAAEVTEIAAKADSFIDQHVVQEELPIAQEPTPEKEVAEKETTLRLRAAVATQPEEVKVPEPIEDEKHGRFAINSLINRMTGGHQKEEKPTQRAQPMLHAAPAETMPDPYQEEQERVDIPAFLRRQAN
ncbi:MAG: cell division protein FtsZ, partial [Rhodobacteraceae bacterium]|nr:cell division protein FtsZ [Paracoccaceae bacterium]